MVEENEQMEEEDTFAVLEKLNKLQQQHKEDDQKMIPESPKDSAGDY